MPIVQQQEAAEVSSVRSQVLTFLSSALTAFTDPVNPITMKLIFLVPVWMAIQSANAASDDARHVPGGKRLSTPLISKHRLVAGDVS